MNPEKEFKRIAKMCVRRLGRKPTTNHQLNALGKELFGKKYIGTYMQNTVPWSKLKSKGIHYAIVNTDTKHKKGVHWIALVKFRKSIILYDSFGRDTKRLMPILTRKAREFKIKIIEPEKDSEQKNNESICGCLCMAFLSVYHKYGLRSALMI